MTRETPEESDDRQFSDYFLDRNGKSLEPEEIEIYLTYDEMDGQVFCAFFDKEQCEREAEECGCGMQTVRLVRKK